MKIVLFTHPTFSSSNSMPRFANMLTEYFEQQGIVYRVWSPMPLFYKIAPKGRFAKWLGYIDQYVFFPIQVRYRLLKEPKSTLFVFCDQALGPWVPLVSKRPHVIHCHDFMALRSALGLHSENPTTASGRVYQKYIQRGFEKGKNFISISQRTRNDLHKYSVINADNSEVVYNGLNYPYQQQLRIDALSKIIKAGLLTQDTGCLLHVGAGQWYKNTTGIIKLYAKYCTKVTNAKPLILVSPNPKGAVLTAVNDIPDNGSVKFVQGLDIDVLEALYSYADVFLFPSLAEGFGWPIIEAQACGCAVITTNDAPMNEIGGPVSSYLMPYSPVNEQAWLDEGVTKILTLLSQTVTEKTERATQAIAWSQRFNSDETLAAYLDIYMKITKGAIG